MPNINYNEKENYFLIYDHESNKLTGILYTKYNDQCNNGYNDNSGGGDDMEERIIKLEADVGSIKEIVKDHNNRFDKIDARLESSEKLINIKLDNLLDNLKENYISYKGLFGMLAVFTAVIGFLIKYFH